MQLVGFVCIDLPISDEKNLVLYYSARSVNASLQKEVMFDLTPQPKSNVKAHMSKER